MYKCLRSRQTAGFRCDGTSCGSLCCKEWRIAVDEATFERITNIPDKEKAAEIAEGIVSDGARRKIKCREDLSCWFLRQEDGLCRLQRDFGEEFLTDVCHEYPRVTYRLDEDTFEQSLTLSCPVAGELVLLGEDPLDFAEEPFVPGREGFVVDMRNKGLPPAAEVFDVQGVGVSILQDRRFTMDERFFILGVTFEELDKRASGGVLNERLTEELLGEIVRNSSSWIASERAEIFSAVYGGGELKAIHFLYAACYGNFFADVLTDKRHVWENFAVNRFCMTLCPYTDDGTMFYNFRTFVLGCKLTEFAAFITAVKDQGRMTKERLAEIIRYVCVKIDHNKDVLNLLRDFAEKEKDGKAFSEKLFAINV